MFAGSVCVVVTGTFVLALVHKIRVLSARQAAAEPVLQRPAFARHHATAFVAAAVAAEVIVVSVLVVRPFVGLLGAIALLAIYTVSVARLPAGNGCGCFGEPETEGKAVALVRNGVLIVLAALAAIETGTTVAVDDVVEPGSFGLALLFGAAPLAITVMRRHVASNSQVARKAAS